jgi:hypothetical protein
MYKHNKKRNIGLISEFFSRYIASAFIDERHEDIEKANAIWKKHVAPGTEIHKELMLFNALHETTLKDRNVAHSLLERVKEEVKKQSQATLDKEKNSLINEIKRSLADDQFFNRNVDDYRTIASIQLLMNAWRGIGFKGSLSDLALLEESIVDNMLRPKPEVAEELANICSADVDGLVVQIMAEKFNRKYAESLNKEQAEIVCSYAFRDRSKQAAGQLSQLLEKIRQSTLKHIKQSIVLESYGGPLTNKLKEIGQLIESGGKYHDVTKISDDLITFYMSLSKLKEEMESPE